VQHDLFSAARSSTVEDNVKNIKDRRVEPIEITSGREMEFRVNGDVLARPRREREEHVRHPGRVRRDPDRRLRVKEEK